MKTRLRDGFSLPRRRRHIGDYQENCEFWVGETGEEVILRLPFLETVTVSNLDWKAETFAFTSSRNGRQHDWKHTKVQSPEGAKMCWRVSTREELLSGENLDGEST
jgi:hypothetical protein